MTAMKKLRTSILIILILISVSCLAYAEGSSRASVEISSNIAGADVYVDGKLHEQAVAPCTVEVSPGEHDISVRVSGYKSCDRHISLSAGETESISAVLEADIPSGEGVRVINVSRERDYPNYSCWDKATWATYERFIVNKLGDWEYEDPERIPYAYDMLTNWGADNTGVNFRLAISIILNDTGYYDEENKIRWHYVIQFADGVSNVELDEKDIVCYGRGYSEYSDGGTLPDTDGLHDMSGNDGDFTINGDKNGDGIADVTFYGKEDYGWDGSRRVMILCSNVHINCVNFAKTCQAPVGMPFHQPKFYADIHDIFYTGCTFESINNNVGRFFTAYSGTYGHGSECKGDYGTYDLDGLTISNCSFSKEQIAIIAACGDIDYCSLRHLTIQANHLVNGYIFVRNVDGHTWYMWGQYSDFGSNYQGDVIGVAEHNTLSDVVISGNRLEYTGDVLKGPPLFDNGYGGMINVGNSNLGGSYNTTENVLIRCNTSVMDQDYIDAYGSFPNGNISIENASIGDSNEMAQVLCEVSHNTMRSVTVEYNDFRTTSLTFANMSVGSGCQQGLDNNFSGLKIIGNNIESVTGLRIYEIHGTSSTETLADGSFTDITVSGNSLTALKKTGWSEDSDINSSGEQDDFGIFVCGASVADFGGSSWDEAGSDVPLAIVPRLDGVSIDSNSISGYANGIGIMAADCARTHFVKDSLVENVSVTENCIVTDNLNRSCFDDGIVIAGAREGGNGCAVDGVVISGNSITSFEGVVCCGMISTGMHLRADVSDNRVDKLRICGNTFTYAAKPDNKKGIGLLTADVLLGWYDLTAAPGLCSVNLIENSGNVYSGYPLTELLLAKYSYDDHSVSGTEASAASAANRVGDAYAELLPNMNRISCEWYDQSISKLAAGPSVFGKYFYLMTCDADELEYRFGNYHKAVLCFNTADVTEPLVFSGPHAEISGDTLNWSVDEIAFGTVNLYIAEYKDGKMVRISSAEVSSGSKSGSISASGNHYRLFFFGSGSVPLCDRLELKK